MLVEGDKPVMSPLTKQGGENMEYVKMPEMLSAEVARVLAGNMGELRAMMEADSRSSGHCGENDDICCPKKVKFILFLNNVVIINVNAVAEDENDEHPHRTV